MTLLVLLALGVDVAPRRPAPACTADGDCLVSTFSGCCGACCPPPPFAVSRADDAAQRRRCAITDCAAPRCEGTRCAKQEPPSAFRAACQSGQCVALRVAPAPYCRADADCRVDYQADSDGCPVSPAAVPQSAPPPPPPPRPLVKPQPGRSEGGPPRFGLTPGGAAAPPPCPPLAPARAACSGGRCVLVRRFDE